MIDRQDAKFAKKMQRKWIATLFHRAPNSLFEFLAF